MEKVLLTGASGFIGSELVPKLLKQGYEVEIIERYVTGRYKLDKGNDCIISYANLTDYPAVRKIIRDSQPDYLIHLAAVSAVAFSYDHYIEVGEANYLGTVNLAESCYRDVPHFKQFIMAGTSEEYGVTLKDTSKKLSEDSQLSPNSPYAVSKVASDLYLRYMQLAYRFPYTILRPYNTYGRKNNTHFFMERAISQMLKQDKVFLGAPDAIRDWLYVDDHVEGYLKALGNKKAIGESIQLCTGKGYTTKETAEMIAKLTNFKGEIVWNATPKRPLDAMVLIGDNSKAKRLLGWEPKVNLEEGLKRTIDYYRKNAKASSM
ncbi:MAG: GDP-mannose 4,6-dehydratase [Candidatus Micrarchaeota archaeon]|nr:GDP-mannose 4,6-dehydratase [Candidatus Micrarchaeota archaeon]